MLACNNHIAAREHRLSSTFAIGTYTDIGDEEDMCNPPWKEPTIRNKIVDLVAKLCDNSQGILKECNDNQESTKCR
jgi:hypothetical protein